MANPHKGEATLTAGERSFTLVYTINSICELEDALNKGINEIVTDMARMSVMRAMLWAGLMDKHAMSLKEAGDVMHEAGLKAVTVAVNSALANAFPAEKGSKANPR